MNRATPRSSSRSRPAPGSPSVPVAGAGLRAGARPSVLGPRRRHGDGCVRLGQAVEALDRLVRAARAAGVTDHPDVRAAFGDAVGAIAATLQGHEPAASSSAAAPEVDWVLVDRAMARFSTRVLGTDVARRACPSEVLRAIHVARRSLEEAAGPVPGLLDDGGVSVRLGTALVVVSDRTRAGVEQIAAAAAATGAGAAVVIGAARTVRTPALRSALAVEYGATGAVEAGLRLGEAQVAAVSGALAARGLEARTMVLPARLVAAEVQELVDGATPPVAVVAAGAVGVRLARRLRRQDVEVTRP